MLACSKTKRNHLMKSKGSVARIAAEAAEATPAVAAALSSSNASGCGSGSSGLAALSSSPCCVTSDSCLGLGSSADE